MSWLYFFGGFIIGAMTGIVLMCLLQIGAVNEAEEEQ